MQSYSGKMCMHVCTSMQGCTFCGTQLTVYIGGREGGNVDRYLSLWVIKRGGEGEGRGRGSVILVHGI